MFTLYQQKHAILEQKNNSQERRVFYEALHTLSEELHHLLSDAIQPNTYLSPEIQVVAQQRLQALADTNRSLQEKLQQAVAQSDNPFMLRPIQSLLEQLKHHTHHFEQEFAAFQAGHDKKLIKNVLKHLKAMVIEEPSPSLAEVATPLSDAQRVSLREALETFLSEAASLFPDYHPSCFISYAWGNSETEAFVQKQLAPHLQQAGVNIRLDIFNHPQLSSSIPDFISQIKQCQYVLIIGTPDYHKKAEAPNGSVVRQEYEIIWDKYKAAPHQIIRILREGNAEESFPATLGGNSRLYADILKETAYFESFPSLLEKLFETPLNNASNLTTKENFSAAIAQYRHKIKSLGINSPSPNAIPEEAGGSPTINPAESPISRSSTFHRLSHYALKSYLEDILREYSQVRLQGVIGGQASLTVPLDKIYIGLAMDSTHPYERHMLDKALNELWKKLLDSEHYLPTPLRDKFRHTLYQTYGQVSFISSNDIIDILHIGDFTPAERNEIIQCVEQLAPIERQLIENYRMKDVTELTVGDAYQRYPHMIILGDPGAGKTTLARWLVVKMAQSLETSLERPFTVKKKELAPLSEEETLVELGSQKLPILINIIEYSQYLRRSGLSERTLESFLSQHYHLTKYQPLIKTALQEKAVALFLDGLDEVTHEQDRAAVINEIHHFLKKYHLPVTRTEHFSHLHPPSPPSRVEEGNRLIVTSRIAGDYTAGFDVHLPRLVIQKMTLPAVKLFFQAWMEAVQQQAQGATTLQSSISEKSPNELANALWAQLQAQPAVLELAHTPLLASLIAGVFYSNRQQLPPTRTLIYKEAIGAVLSRLQQRFTRSASPLLLSESEWLSVLAPVATFMQTHNNVITTEQLKETLFQSIPVVKEGLSTQLVDKMVDDLLIHLRSDVGLLVAIGPHQFKFIHRSLQEYVVAFSLAKKLQAGVSTEWLQDFRTKIEDSLWHQPVMMAIGYASNAYPERFLPFLGALLASPATSSENYHELPTAALLLVEALPEISWSTLKPDAKSQTISHILKAFFHVYQQYTDETRFASSRQHLEKVVSQLFRQNTYSDVVENNLIEDLHTPLLAPAVAELIYQSECYTARIAAALYEALPYDTSEWQWSIQKTWQHLLSAKPELLQELTIEREGMRACFRQTPSLVEKINHSAAWLRLFLSLYGGYNTTSFKISAHEYHTIAAYLQLHDSKRLLFQHFFGQRWGMNDPIYSMAVYLDTIYGNSQPWLKPLVFSPTFFYQESTLTSFLYKALVSNTPKEEIVERLIQEIQNSSNSNSVDAYLALIALGIPLPTIEAKTRPLSTEIKVALKKELRKIASYLSNLIPRAVNAINKTSPSNLFINLPSQSSRFSAFNLFTKPRSNRWMLSALIATGKQYKSMPFATDRWQAHFLEASAYLSSEYFAHKLTGQSDDIIKTITAAIGTKPIDVPAILLLGHTHQRYQPTAGVYWPMECLVVEHKKEKDIPIPVMNMVARAPAVISFTREWLLGKQLVSLVKQNPLLIAEVYLIALSDTGERSNRADFLSLLNEESRMTEITEDMSVTSIKALIWQKISSLPDPYYHARALWRWQKVFTDNHETVFTQAVKVAADIKDPLQKAEMYSYLLQEAPLPTVREDFEANANSLFACAWKATLQVKEPRSQARLLARLALAAPEDMQEKILIKALEAIVTLNNPFEQAYELSLLQPQWSLSPTLSHQVELIKERLKTYPDAYALAHEQRGPLLLPLTAAENLQKASNLNMTPLVLGALVYDAQTYLKDTQDIKEIWLQYYREPTPDNAALLYERANKESVVLSRLAIVIIDRLYEQHKKTLQALLPLLVHTEPEVLLVLRRWWLSGDTFQREYAALVFTEMEGLHPKYISAVLSLLSSPMDLLRHRANHIIEPPSDLDFLTRYLSVIGKAVIEKIAGVAKDTHTPPAIGLKLHWLVQHTLFDDETIISEWLDVNPLKDAPSSVSTVCYIISHVHAATPQVWEMLLAQLPKACEQVQQSIFLAVARLLYKKRLSEEDWQHFYEVFRRVASAPWEERHLTKNIADFIKIVYENLPHTNANQELSSLANHLRSIINNQCTYSWREIQALQNEETIKASFLAIGRNNYYYEKEETKLFLEGALLFKEQPQLITPLLCVAIAFLSQPLLNIEEAFVVGRLLELLEACATQIPVAFTRLVHSPISPLPPHYVTALPELLVSAVKSLNSFPGRSAALKLLGHMGYVSMPIIKAIQIAMQDVYHVREAALWAVQQLREEHSDITLLLNDLHHPSAVYVYTLVQLLISLGTSDRTSNATKQSIIATLKQARNEPTSKRYVYFDYTEGTLPTMPRLDHVFTEALVKIQQNKSSMPDLSPSRPQISSAPT